MPSLLDQILSGNPHLSTGERALSVALGLGLAAAATKPRPNPLLNLLALAAGAALAYRGATGYCHLKAALGDRHVDRLPGFDRWVGRHEGPGGTGALPGRDAGGGTLQAPPPVPPAASAPGGI